MASPVKVSKYRSGPPRFGRADTNWNSADTLKTYKLTPEELEQYKSGQKTIDEILRGREGTKVTLEITVDEFVDLFHNQKLSMKEIAARKGVPPQSIYSWKYNRKKEVEKALKEATLKGDGKKVNKNPQKEIKNENEPQNEEIKINKEDVNMSNEPQKEREKEISDLENQMVNARKIIKKQSNDIWNLEEKLEKLKSQIEEKSNTIAEKDDEIDRLAREVIDAHKQLTEWQEKCEKLKEQRDVALKVKDHAITENAELENERLKLERENKKLAEELAALKKEKAILVEFSYQKLSKEGESA